MAGTFSTNRVTNVKLKLKELNPTAEIKSECHVTKQKSNYNSIIGRNVLCELGIISDFANNKTIWENVEIPMKPLDCTKREYFSTYDSSRAYNETKRIKKLDATHSKANLSQLLCDLNYINKSKQETFLSFLRKYDDMFDGTLGNYNGSDYKIELNEKLGLIMLSPSLVHVFTKKL